MIFIKNGGCVKNGTQNEEHYVVAMYTAILAFDIDKIWKFKNKNYSSILRGLAYCFISNAENGCHDLKEMMDDYIRKKYNYEEGCDSEKVKMFEAMMKYQQADDLDSGFLKN